MKQAATENYDEMCYAAFKAKDARFDGRFFVGISSTGIYCRPVCRVRMPKKENCSYYPSAAAAEAAGFRPCLKCRPELAPGLAPIDALAGLARKAALAMEVDGPDDARLPELADSLGVTDRHLRRAFRAEFGVSPVQYLQTRRLLLAKNLLTDTDLSIIDVALAAGFGSLRRFNHLFKSRYRLSPAALRRQSAARPTAAGDHITLNLGYRPPYEWDKMLAFLGGRAIGGVEETADGFYRRTVALAGGGRMHDGWISVGHSPEQKAIIVTMAAGLLPVLPQVLARVKGLFDLQANPAEIYETLSALDEIKPGLSVAGTRLPGCFDPFEMAVRAVLGQQITVKAARTLATRLASAYGRTINTPFGGLTHIFPPPETIAALEGPAADHLGPLGVIGARARSIQALARALASGELELSPRADGAEQKKKLAALPGFGPWTVEYIAMRALGQTDAFPHTDYGVKKALEGLTAKEILTAAERWRPWRAYATVNLWNSL